MRRSAQPDISQKWKYAVFFLISQINKNGNNFLLFRFFFFVLFGFSSDPNHPHSGDIDPRTHHIRVRDEVAKRTRCNLDGEGEKKRASVFRLKGAHTQFSTPNLWSNKVRLDFMQQPTIWKSHFVRTKAKKRENKMRARNKLRSYFIVLHISQHWHGVLALGGEDALWRCGAQGERETKVKS